jgi:acetyl-CoA carboxylase carboxyl transferase subunit beta
MYMKQKTMLLREQVSAVFFAKELFTSSPNVPVVTCPACRALLYRRDYERNRKVCSLCNYHFTLSIAERVHLLVDPGSFVPIDIHSRPGKSNQGQSCEHTQHCQPLQNGLRGEEAVIAGYASVESSPCVLALTNPHFHGARKGWFTAEQVARAIETAIERDMPVCTIVAGLTLEDDIPSRIQLAKITSVLARLGDARLPYISLLADHVSGTAASFTLLGDVNLAECSCFVNFIHPSVRWKDDNGTSCERGIPAETLLQHGMLDALVPRHQLRSTLARFLRFYAGRPSHRETKRERARPVAASQERDTRESGYQLLPRH